MEYERDWNEAKEAEQSLLETMPDDQSCANLAETMESERDWNEAKEAEQSLLEMMPVD